MQDVEISPAVLERAKKLIAKDEEKAAKRESHIAAKYPHADVSTLRVLPHGTGGQTAFAVDITCTVCGERHGPVFTSDLFQKSTCPACAGEAKKAKLAKKKAEMDEAKAYLAAKKLAGE